MHLIETRDRLLALPALEDRMSVLETEVRETQANLSKLLRKYNKESRDVEQLQKGSLFAFLLRSAGKLEDKLEEKQREEINAKLAYDRTATHLDNLTQEKNELASRIAPLKAEEEIFLAELENRRAKVIQMLTEPQGIRYTELKNERNALIPQITKLKEALRITSLVISTAQKIAVSLGKAGQFDPNFFISRGILVPTISLIASLGGRERHSNIVNAEETFPILVSQMRELMSELRGIQDLHTSSLTEILSKPLNMEFVFSVAFTNLPMHDQIRDKAQEITHILNVIRDIEAELISKLTEQEDKYTHNRRNEEELLFSIL